MPDSKDACPQDPDPNCNTMVLSRAWPIEKPAVGDGASDHGRRRVVVVLALDVVARDASRGR